LQQGKLGLELPKGCEDDERGKVIRSEVEQHDNDDNGNDNDSDKHDNNNDKNHEFDQETVQGIEVGTRCKITSWNYGGEVAPWLSRCGHSLDALDTDGDGDGISDIMVLMGGYESEESNDVWISPNGSMWYFAGFAPWPRRVYHATLVTRGKLWMIGGTPLTNDAWSGTFIRDEEKRSVYRIRWVVKVAHGTAPFAPR